MSKMGPVRTDFQAIQQDEIEALRSIYMDDFKEMQKKAAWNVGERSPRLSIDTDLFVVVVDSPFVHIRDVLLRDTTLIPMAGNA